MATSAEIHSFINKLAPIAQKAYKTLGKVYPSICIAMACVECAYGTAGSVKHHSYFGQKVGTGKTATKYWSGKFFNSKTKEEYTVGTHTVITSAFRAYDSLEQCTFNYYELLNTSLYKKVQAGVHYTTQMRQIKECGYMTSSTEVNSVLKIIEKYNLTRYDGHNTVASAGEETYNMKTIKRGSKGTAVKIWQVIIGVEADGVYGANTEKATKVWQKENGLSSDGIVGTKSWKAGLESV